MPRPWALTRRISSTFADALAEIPADPKIDVARAQVQHDAYVQALSSIGLEVITLQADDRFPDGCFVEDCALVAGDLGLITRPGAPSRRDEVIEIGGLYVVDGVFILHGRSPPWTRHSAFDPV